MELIDLHENCKEIKATKVNYFTVDVEDNSIEIEVLVGNSYAQDNVSVGVAIGDWQNHRRDLAFYIANKVLTELDWVVNHLTCRLTVNDFNIESELCKVIIAGENSKIFKHEGEVIFIEIKRNCWRSAVGIHKHVERKKQPV